MGKEIFVSKDKFDGLLKKVAASKPKPKTSIKTPGKHGPKTPILMKP